MKRYISTSEDIFAMSKVVKKYAISEITPYIGDFIYFSASNSTHGPRIKFCGGTTATKDTKNCPSMTFDANGNCDVKLANWMNKSNCPNAFDANYVANLKQFIQNNLAILLLVWFKHLDEGTVLAYFYGSIPFSEVISDIEYEIPSNIQTADELYKYCIKNDLYKF